MYSNDNKVFTRQDGQEIIKVYLDTRSEAVSVIHPYCYLSMEDKDLVFGSLHANKNLYTHKTSGGKTVGVHRLVVANKEGISLEDFEVADHINGVPLDNTRPNLRSVTRRENSCNSGYHFSINGNDRRLGLDILELEMRGIISVEQGDKIYNKRVKDFIDRGVCIVDYLSFAFWFRDDDLRFYAPDLYDYIPDDMLRKLIKNTFVDYHRLDVLEYTFEEKQRLQDIYEYTHLMPDRRIAVNNSMILHNVYPKAYQDKKKREEEMLSSIPRESFLMCDYLQAELEETRKKGEIILPYLSNSTNLSS